MTQSSAPTTGSKDFNPFALVLRRALVPTAVAGVLTALVFLVVGGVASGVSGLAGALVAVAFFGSGMFVVSKVVRDTSNPMLFMAVGMSVYFAQVIVLLGVLFLAREVESLDFLAAGVSMGVAVVVWQVAQVVTWRRAQMPIYDEPAATADEPATPTASRSDSSSEVPTDGAPTAPEDRGR